MTVAWVTGGRGFIGRRLTQSLRAQGTVVCGVGHGHLPAESWSQAGFTHWVNSQVTAEAFDQLASRCGTPELVFHLAGGSSVGGSLQAPFEDFMRSTATTAALLEWLRTHAARAKLLVTSSAAVYGDTGDGAARESRPPAPVSPYGYHKLMMEQLCREYAQLFGLQTAVIRLFSVYGEGLRKQLLWDCSTKLLAAGESLELGGSGNELRDWVHVDDAVAMMQRVAAEASLACPIINGGSGIGVPVRELVTLLAGALQSPKRIVFSGARRAGDPAALVADTSHLGALGHVCRVALPVGVQRYAEWFMRSRDEW